MRSFFSALAVSIITGVLIPCRRRCCKTAMPSIFGIITSRMMASYWAAAAYSQAASPSWTVSTVNWFRSKKTVSASARSTSSSAISKRIFHPSCPSSIALFPEKSTENIRERPCPWPCSKLRSDCRSGSEFHPGIPWEHSAFSGSGCRKAHRACPYWWS